MVLNGCSMPSGCASMNTRAYKVSPASILSACLPPFPAKAALWSFRNSHLKSNSLLCGGPLLGEQQGGTLHTILLLPRKSRSRLCPQAFDDGQGGFRYPPMTRKPRWWWRTLACITYLLPLHESWMYAQTTTFATFFFDHLQYATYPFLRRLGVLPRWSLLVYFISAYLGIVRRKEWPHFFRYHVVMGMLLEISLQVVGIPLGRWAPSGFYWGKFGRHLWTFLGFGFFFTVVQCIVCAISGMYADVPFICDAAYYQIPYE